MQFSRTGHFRRTVAVETHLFAASHRQQGSTIGEENTAFLTDHSGRTRLDIGNRRSDERGVGLAAAASQPSGSRPD